MKPGQRGWIALGWAICILNLAIGIGYGMFLTPAAGLFSVGVSLWMLPNLTRR